MPAGTRPIASTCCVVLAEAGALRAFRWACTSVSTMISWPAARWAPVHAPPPCRRRSPAAALLILTHPSLPTYRYLQTHTQPPVPPLRLVVLVNIVGLATCLLIHALPLTVRHLYRRRQERIARQQAGLPTHSAAAAELGAASAVGSSSDSVKAEKSELSRPSTGSGSTEWHDAADAAEQQPQQAAAQPHQGMGSQSVKAQTTAAAAAAADHAVPEQQWHAAATAADEEAGGGSGPHLPPPTRLKSTVRPTLPLERGMSARFERLEQRQPRLYRSLALAALTTAFACGFVGQISAPGLVDPSIGGWTAAAQNCIRGHCAHWLVPGLCSLVACLPAACAVVCCRLFFCIKAPRCCCSTPAFETALPPFPSLVLQFNWSACSKWCSLRWCRPRCCGTSCLGRCGPPPRS